MIPTLIGSSVNLFKELIKQDLKVEGLETELQALRDCLSRIPPEDELSEEARNLRHVLNFLSAAGA